MDPHAEWKEHNGDETYALEWPINRNALIWEIGGFQGRWARQMLERYDAHIEIFEPQPWATTLLRNLFAGQERVTINPYGLWVTDAALPLYNYETDGASLLQPGARSQVCEFRDVYGEIDGNIDVGLMNIEGSEFVLIPYMLGNDLMKNFRFFWCQFHTFVPHHKQRMKIIYAAMEKTHRVMWDFFPSAVAWERK